MADSSPQFTQRRFARGYDADEVDTLLAAASAALAQGTEVPDIGAARFRPKMGGYSEAEVDDFLDELRSGIAGPSAEGTATISVNDLPKPPPFTTVRGFRRGYGVEGVNAFLADVWSAVREGDEAPSVVQVSFTSDFKGGYDETEVDEYLDVLRAALKQ